MSLKKKEHMVHVLVQRSKKLSYLRRRPRITSSVPASNATALPADPAPISGAAPRPAIAKVDVPASNNNIPSTLRIPILRGFSTVQMKAYHEHRPSDHPSGTRTIQPEFHSTLHTLAEGSRACYTSSSSIRLPAASSFAMRKLRISGTRRIRSAGSATLSALPRRRRGFPQSISRTCAFTT